MGALKDPYNLIVTGVGGQGNVLMSLVLGRVLVEQGFKVTIGETYGASQRGGSVMSHLRLSRKSQYSPLIPQGQADLVVSLEPLEGLRVLGDYGQPRVLSLVNTRPVLPMSVLSGDKEYPPLDQVLEQIARFSQKMWTVDATRIALDLGDPVLSNLVLLGGLDSLGIIPLDPERFRTVLEELLPPSRLELNLKAFDLGKEAAQVWTPSAAGGQD